MIRNKVIKNVVSLYDMALIHITIHPTYNEDKLDDILKKLNKAHAHLDFIIKQQIQMAKKIDEINEQLDEINDATNNIAADLDRLAGQTEGGLSAAEAESVSTRLRESATALRAVANRNPEEPPMEPTPEP